MEARYEFFYDGQIRRWLLQVVRAFSGFQYEMGKRDPNQPAERRVVPCRMASLNRQVGHIMRNNSENTILSVPLITVWIKEVNPARDRTQAPGFISTVQVTEREVDNSVNPPKYTGKKGNSYTVERPIPHPLDITIQVDLWTSNEQQKHQLWEQIYSAFNVGFDIQSSDNPLDWTALSTMTMESCQWSSRNVPIGTDNEIDVASFIFKLPAWITPPAKVKQQKIIQQIVTNILAGEADYQNSIDGEHPEVNGLLLAQQIITPDDAQIRVELDPVDGMIVTLLGKNGSSVDSSGQPYRWDRLLEQYGTMYPAQSELRLRADIEQADELDIIGTIQPHATLPNVLLWQVDIDTLPSNTLGPVNGILNPLRNFPGDGVVPAAVEGQRYLVTEDMGANQAWGIPTLAPGQQMFAGAGDIIQFTNGSWVRVFDARNTTTVQYVLNLKTGKQLKFHEGSWIMAIEGDYHAGFWRLRL